MSIGVKGFDGFDFNDYLKDFADTFERQGRGAFSDGLSGDEYVLWSGDDTTIPVEGGQAFIIESGDDGDLAYNFADNTVGGTIDAIEFGVGVTEKDGDFSTSASVRIENLDLSSTGGEGIVNQLILDLMEGNTDVLLDILSDQDIAFKGSSGNDAFASFAGDDSLKGGAGNDKFDGGAGKDLINGGAGNDKLAGGDGFDTFVFAKNSGADKILDFEGGKGKGDVIDFTSDQFSSFKEVMASAQQKGDNVVIKFDDGSKLTLVDTSLDDLHKSDFIFG